MTVRQLIRALEEWPPDADVGVVVKGGAVHDIREVHGVAGSRIDGSDSQVVIATK